MCTYVHISVTKWCIVGYGTGAWWDLCPRSIVQVIGFILCQAQTAFNESFHDQSCGLYKMQLCKMQTHFFLFKTITGKVISSISKLRDICKLFSFPAFISHRCVCFLCYKSICSCISSPHQMGWKSGWGWGGGVDLGHENPRHDMHWCLTPKVPQYISWKISSE